MLLSLEIEIVEALADGASFGEAGAYERVIAVARGEVDPTVPANSGIALIDKAPRKNERPSDHAPVIVELA